MEDDRRALPPEDGAARAEDAGELPPGDPQELAKPPEPPTGRAVLVTATAMVAPPVIAAIAGSLGLAIAVGMMSIFACLLGFSVFVYGTEHWHRRRPTRLPRARARARLRT